MIKVALGMDIGGTNSVFGLVDNAGNLLLEDNISTPDYKTIEEFALAVYNKLESRKEEFEGKYQIVGFGIGAPNANYYSGNIEYAMNLNWQGIVPIKEVFEKQFNVKTIVTNDANAAAIGEMVYGNAKGMKDFIMITLGTGLGSGIVINGELVYGHDGFAGELGHITVNPNGRKCGCGRMGCLETYVSATGIKRTVYKLLAKYNNPSKLRDIPFNQLTAKMITEAAMQDDTIAHEAFDYTAKILGAKLADAVAFSSPEAIFLFGGLANAGDYVFLPVKKYMEQFLLPIFRNKVKIIPSALQKLNAAILGASAPIFLKHKVFTKKT